MQKPQREIELYKKQCNDGFKQVFLENLTLQSKDLIVKIER
ncbi:hypothetical protein SAMN05421740_102191 [Parapedobacter koreensis]|uniref:Uncharacterized protein n=1 Tax=Parapedobacter koreensis TaxID=332977 RepID=A0A1H7IED0_9SPHI|nr:hypothetical protein SAMN05421740_102191 [Parapedobacter koreensis]